MRLWPGEHHHRQRHPGLRLHSLRRERHRGRKRNGGAGGPPPRGATRRLRPGGRLAISDVIADEDMNDATRDDMQKWTGCIAGALTRREFEQALSGAGFVEIEISETHRVHDQAAAAVIRATKPDAA